MTIKAVFGHRLQQRGFTNVSEIDDSEESRVDSELADERKFHQSAEMVAIVLEEGKLRLPVRSQSVKNFTFRL